MIARHFEQISPSIHTIYNGNKGHEEGRQPLADLQISSERFAQRGNSFVGPGGAPTDVDLYNMAQYCSENSEYCNNAMSMSIPGRLPVSSLTIVLAAGEKWHTGLVDGEGYHIQDR